MMMAVAGSILKVRGSNMAIVAAGPRPGRTPTTVPRTTPTKHQKRLTGVRATENPRIRFPTASNFSAFLQKPQGPVGKETPRARGKIRWNPRERATATLRAIHGERRSKTRTRKNVRSPRLRLNPNLGRRTIEPINPNHALMALPGPTQDWDSSPLSLAERRMLFKTKKRAKRRVAIPSQSGSNPGPGPNSE
jgi:hypothetical protein